MAETTVHVDAREPARFFLDMRGACPVAVDLPAGRAVVLSAPCPGREGRSEDAAVVIPSPLGAVIAVADGAGGSPAGDQAATIAVNAVAAAVEQAIETNQPLREAIVDAFELANQRVLELGVGAATTLAVATLESASVRPFHAGDSCVFVTGQRGRTKLATLSHAPVAYGVEAGLIEQDEALHHDDLNLISNFVGTTDMRVEIGPETSLAAFDTVIVGSDGLFDNMQLDEIVSRVRKGDLMAAAKDLADTCLRRMTEPQDGAPCKPDDVTFVLYRRSH